MRMTEKYFGTPIECKVDRLGIDALGHNKTSKLRHVLILDKSLNSAGCGKSAPD